MENMGQRIGYARVSTEGQTTQQQVYELERAGCDQIFVDDGVRATAKNRPGLDAAKEALQFGDVFVVWAIDRAFRSTLDAILFLDGLMDRGVEFLSLTQSIDTRTPEGRKWYIDTASWAEYERAIISRRTIAKMQEAKRRGIRLGRPPALDAQTVRQAYRQIRTYNRSIRTVAQELGVAPITISRAIKRMEVAA
ncbi:recombinase family protein [uncultured Cohaesibacter sp.]|uniref:recombinase family protein n=1 Tax=uncultured Cohaesibacter sp. TaxID=1002546 RepID=UPI002AA75C13|nr:recombinase family protein [uncultured Cohaesibacter sp.]